VRALGERTRPRDLYDVVNLYRHTDTMPSASVLLDVLRQKCAYKNIPVPTYDGLLSHRAALEQMWKDMLSHQLPVLPPLNDFWEALPEIFSWMTGVAEIPQRGFIRHDPGETPVISRVLPMSVPMRSRPVLEIIRFAAANYLCVDIIYDDGHVRRIEAYSLRQTSEGNFVLHSIKANTGEHRSYRVDRIRGATVTSQVFRPRYTVELTSTGPLHVQPAATHATTAPHRPTAHHGPTYVYRCPYCQKTFNRRTMDSSLNPHKDRHGYPCPGRTGMYVTTKY
jgi:Nucleotidyl transferase AbiEii toxin, Type IV TA system/WYL domain